VIEAGQLTQSAHFACQLPYVMFGLGPTPNYVEKVGVGIPNYVGNKVQFQFSSSLVPSGVDDMHGLRFVVNPTAVNLQRHYQTCLTFDKAVKQ